MVSYNLRQLRYFVATVEAGSVAEASRTVNISQPSISASIKALEEGFGVQLLIRHHASGISLTPVGARFYRHALELLGHARAFEQNALDENDALSGRIELGFYVTFGPLYVPSLLAKFRQLYPRVAINLRDGLQNTLIDGLRLGTFDLVLMYDFGLDPSIERIVLLPDLKPHVVLPKTHRLAGEAAIPLAAVVDEPFILLDVPPSGGYFRSIFSEVGLTPKVAYTSPSLEMVRSLVGQGLGYSVLATRPASPVTYDGNEIVTVPVSDRVGASTMVVAWSRQTQMTKQARALVDFCQLAISASHSPAA
jgi:DNA-binding transcriptional LysR family regulator